MATATTEPQRQPGFTMEYQEHQDRLSTFFRFLTAIPGFFVLSLWAIAVFFTLIVSWFALLFTGRYPQSLYEFHASFARYSTTMNGYWNLATDKWPGFSGSPDIAYPVALHLGPPLPLYSRIKVLLRLIIAIPVYLIAYAMQIVAQIGSFIAWFAIVFTGKLPQGVYQMLRLGVSYQQRALPYFLLLTEDWPSFTVEDDRRSLEPGPAPSPLGGPGATPEPADIGGFAPPTSPSAPPPAPEQPDPPAEPPRAG